MAVLILLQIKIKLRNTLSHILRDNDDKTHSHVQISVPTSDRTIYHLYTIHNLIEQIKYIWGKNF